MAHPTQGSAINLALLKYFSMRWGKLRGQITEIFHKPFCKTWDFILQDNSSYTVCYICSSPVNNQSFPSVQSNLPSTRPRAFFSNSAYILFQPYLSKGQKPVMQHIGKGRSEVLKLKVRDKAKYQANSKPTPSQLKPASKKDPWQLERSLLKRRQKQKSLGESNKTASHFYFSINTNFFQPGYKKQIQGPALTFGSTCLKSIFMPSLGSFCLFSIKLPPCPTGKIGYKTNSDMIMKWRLPNNRRSEIKGPCYGYHLAITLSTGNLYPGVGIWSISQDM